MSVYRPIWDSGNEPRKTKPVDGKATTPPPYWEAETRDPLTFNRYEVLAETLDEAYSVAKRIARAGCPEAERFAAALMEADGYLATGTKAAGIELVRQSWAENGAAILAFCEKHYTDRELQGLVRKWAAQCWGEAKASAAEEALA